MNLTLGLVALLTSFTISTGAVANCRTMPFHAFPAQNDSVSTTGVMDSRGCIHRFVSFSNQQFTSSTIAARPSHGTLTAAGAMQFRYVPKSGYKGSDSYAIRVCGKGNDGSGCSKVTYNVTIE